MECKTHKIKRVTWGILTMKMLMILKWRLNDYKKYNYRTKMMQSYPSRELDRRLQEDWAKDAREDPRVLMSLRVDFGPWANYEPTYLCTY